MSYRADFMELIYAIILFLVDWYVFFRLLPLYLRWQQTEKGVLKDIPSVCYLVDVNYVDYKMNVYVLNSLIRRDTEQCVIPWQFKVTYYGNYISLWVNKSKAAFVIFDSLYLSKWYNKLDLTKF